MKYILPVFTLLVGLVCSVSAYHSADPYNLGPAFNMVYYFLGMLFLGGIYIIINRSYKKGQHGLKDQVKFAIPVSVLVLTVIFMINIYVLDEKVKERDRQYEMIEEQENHD